MNTLHRACCCEDAGGLFCCSAIPSACFLALNWETGSPQDYAFDCFAGRPWYNDANRIHGRMSGTITVTGPGGTLEIELDEAKLIGKGMQGQIHPVLGCTGNPPDPATLPPDFCTLELPRCALLEERWHSCSRHYLPIWRQGGSTIVAPLCLHAFPWYLEGGWPYSSGSDCSWSPASHVYAGILVVNDELHAILGSPAERIVWDGMQDDIEGLETVFLSYDPDRRSLEILVIALSLAGEAEDLGASCDPPEARFFRPFGQGLHFTRGPVTLVNSALCMAPSDSGPGGPGGGGGGPLPPCISGDGSISAEDVEVDVQLDFENEWRYSPVCGCRRSLPERCPIQLEIGVDYTSGELDGGAPCGTCSWHAAGTCSGLIIGPAVCCGVNDGTPFVGYGIALNEAECTSYSVTGTLCGTADGDDEPSCLAMVTTPGTAFIAIVDAAILPCDAASWRIVDSLGDWPMRFGEPTIKVVIVGGASGTLAGDVELPVSTWINSLSTTAYAVWSADDPEHPCPTGTWTMYERAAIPGDPEPWRVCGTISISEA